jgi:hypothetical protein
MHHLYGKGRFVGIEHEVEFTLERWPFNLTIGGTNAAKAWSDIAARSKTLIIEIPAFEGETSEGDFRVRIPLMGLVAPGVFKCIVPTGWLYPFELRVVERSVAEES